MLVWCPFCCVLVGSEAEVVEGERLTEGMIIVVVVLRWEERVLVDRRVFSCLPMEREYI